MRRAGWNCAVAIQKTTRLVLLAAIWCVSGPRLVAADPSADLTAALRQRGWNDTALEFLDWAPSTPLIGEEFRRLVPFHRATVLAEQGRRSRSRSERTRLLTEAAQSFAEFADSKPGALPAIDALRQAASAHAELGLASLADAENMAGGAELRASARGELELAGSLVERIVAGCESELAALPKPAVIQADPEAKKLRDQLRSRLAEARYLQALLKFERSRTFPKGEEATEAFTEAGELFGDLVAEYRDTLVAASSRFYQGRCWQERGDMAKALGCYDDLVRLPAADPEFRRWTARAHRRRAECLAELGKWEEAVRDGEEWLAASRPAERDLPEWLEVAYRLAKSCQGLAKSLADNPAAAKQLDARARELLRVVADKPNEFQKLARVATVSASSQAASSPDDLSSFDKALEAGRAALEKLSSAELAVRLAKENNPEAVPELQQDVDSAKREAGQLLWAALELADADTPIERLNDARYYACWLSYDHGDYYDAATLGDFLATRFPESEVAPSAAKVALAAYQQIVRSEPPPDDASAGRSYASARLTAIAELTLSRWPDSPEAAGAVSMLVAAALSEGRIDAAEQLLERLPAGARAEAQMSLGSAIWEQANRLAGEKSADEAAIAATRKKATDYLTEAFAAVRQSGRATAASVVGALYLAQSLLAEGRAAGAIDVLEDKAAGPLALIAAGSPAMEQTVVVREALKTGLRAYLSVSPPRREQAQAMVESLERLEPKKDGGDAKSVGPVTAICLDVGRQLLQQLRDLKAAGKTEEARQTAAALDDVLKRVAERDDADRWAVRVWLAQGRLEAGEALGGGDSHDQLAEARKAFEAILAAAAKDPRFAPSPAAVLAVRMKLAETSAALGEHDKAAQQYEELLKARPQAVEFQKSAAGAFEEQGAATGEIEALNQAVHGAWQQANGQNLAWGWIRLARIAQAQRQRHSGKTDAASRQAAARFADLYFEANLHVARCRFVAAKLAPASQRAGQLAAVRKIVDVLTAQYPDLGGPQWKSQFDRLLAEVGDEEKR
jgi:hypothetical protein